MGFYFIVMIMWFIHMHTIIMTKINISVHHTREYGTGIVHELEVKLNHVKLKKHDASMLS